MQTSRKKIATPPFLESRRNTHASGLTASRLLFARVDRVVKALRLPSRGDFMTAATSAILNMCDGNPTDRRVLPALVVRYDELQKRPAGKLKIENPSGAQRAGTHFSLDTEERIAEVVKRIGWSRNQFISEALRTLVDMCEDPDARQLPLVVILHDAAVNAAPSPLSG